MRRLLFILGFFPALCLAGPVQITAVHLSSISGHTQVVFDASGPIEHTLFTLSNPNRIVIDVAHASLNAGHVPAGQGMVERIRSARRQNGSLRLVLDLSEKAIPRSFVTAGQRHRNDRLVVDLYPSDSISNVSAPVVEAAPPVRDGRDIVVAIDPGHGGIDSGARGPHGIMEKTVTLQIGRRLARLVNATPGMKAVLTRNGDYYLRLRQRIERARAKHADIFISIHADASRDRHADGSTVYALSLRGATDEAARWLADRENDADLIGGVSLNNKGNMLASVLLDLSQTATIKASLDVGRSVLHQLGHISQLHKDKVQQAGFVVLKSPDIPSILIETDYITNPREARRLRNPNYQYRMAKAILAGVENYFDRYPPPGTLLAERLQKHRQVDTQKYVVERGDTLTSIANRYNISLESLRSFNQLDSDSIQPGDVLRIPSSTG